MQSTGEPAASVGEAIHPSAPGRTAAGTPGTALAFALVGAYGIIVNQVLLWILVSIGGVNYLAGAVIATQGSTAWNFSLNEMWVFQARRRGKGVVRRFTAYWAVNNATLLLRGPMLVLFTSKMHIHYLVSNLLTLVALFAIRFLVSDRFIWRARPRRAMSPPAGPSATRPRRGPRGAARVRRRRAKSSSTAMTSTGSPPSPPTWNCPNWSTSACRRCRRVPTSRSAWGTSGRGPGCASRSSTLQA